MATTRPRHAKAADFTIHDEESEEMIGSDVASDENRQGMDEEPRRGRYEEQRRPVYEERHEEHDVEHDGDEQEDDYNSDTSEDQENVDPLVLEDMQKFENFQGFNKRFRLINRIGEGMLGSDFRFVCLR